LGAIAASALGDSTKLIVPENGMISLNVPLTPLRTGSHSTRTTHPHYFLLMQELFMNMQLGVTIENPYQFKTKGEMLSECVNNKLVVTTETMSCSHPSGRWQGQANGHCGYCVPCIIRQASYKAAGLTEIYHYRTDIFVSQGLQIEQAEGRDIMAFKYMIEKIHSKPIFLTATIRSTGPLGDSMIDYVDVYRRSLIEVESLINNVNLR
ncbi:MAG TPA: 7-cyano-7-deazaguanine synthase, partial [Chitinophagaceae bacterium]|nr:7-cyano-7-deazaguanine synthase [Chitinophagaceae bacterium]